MIYWLKNIQLNRERFELLQTSKASHFIIYNSLHQKRGPSIEYFKNI